jgi:hypothetical protein
MKKNLYDCTLNELIQYCFSRSEPFPCDHCELNNLTRYEENCPITAITSLSKDITLEVGRK